MSDQKIMRRTLYGRRKGQGLRQNLAQIYKDILPRYQICPSEIPDLCSAKSKIWMEIGFGGGEHLAHQAKLYPDVHFIGCEPFMNGVAKTLRELYEGNIKNVHLYEGDARDILKLIPDHKLEKVFVLYPDPWPKRKHIKRRFFKDEALSLLAQKMNSGGQLRLATDIDDYAATALRAIALSAHFDWPATHDTEWILPWSDWISTRYEQKAFREGRQPSYFTFYKK